jgi:hypothetical protein
MGRVPVRPQRRQCRRRVQRYRTMSDDVFVSTHASTAPRAPSFEVLSPELVLVDPSLRAAWQLRAEAGDVDPHPPRTAVPVIPLDREAAARRLARDALAAEVADRAPVRRRRRPLRLAAAAMTLFAAVAIALAAFGVRLETREPATVPAPAAPAQPPEQRVATGGAKLPSAAPAGGRRFTWAPVAGATGYHIELFRGMERVFTADPARPEVVIPAKWEFEGRARRLDAVEYRWYVWPIVSGRRAPDAVVQARLVVRDS